ncbi:MAG: FkbM family methyltransferase [Candidatus Aenigmatarchaeota archaeon]
MIRSFCYVISRIKERVSLLLWSRILFSFSVKKDLSKIFSFFARSYREKYLKYLKDYDRVNNLFIKKKFFGNFIFYMRHCDFGALKEVLLDKDYFLLQDFLPKKGDIILDLGAGTGDYAILCSLKIGNGKIVSIEADKFVYKLLTKNIQLNKRNNIVPLNIKVGKEKIDKIVKKLKLHKLDLIKIDIEGYEYVALCSAKYSLKKFRPKIIIEIHSEKLRRKIIELLKGFDYELVYEKLKKDMGFYLSYFK